MDLQIKFDVTDTMPQIHAGKNFNIGNIPTAIYVKNLKCNKQIAKISLRILKDYSQSSNESSYKTNKMARGKKNNAIKFRQLSSWMA